MESDEIKELKALLKNVHNDVENVKRELEVAHRKIDQFVYMLADYLHIPEEEYEKVINIDPDLYSSLDELYSPVDEVDKILWEEHIKINKRINKGEKIDK